MFLLYLNDCPLIFLQLLLQKFYKNFHSKKKHSTGKRRIISEVKKTNHIKMNIVFLDINER